MIEVNIPIGLNNVDSLINLEDILVDKVYDNFNNDMYSGEIDYHGYGDTNFYLTINKLDEGKEYNILFRIKANTVDLSYAIVDGKHLSSEDRDLFVHKLIGYGYIYG